MWILSVFFRLFIHGLYSGVYSECVLRVCIRSVCWFHCLVGDGESCWLSAPQHHHSVARQQAPRWQQACLWQGHLTGIWQGARDTRAAYSSRAPRQGVGGWGRSFNMLLKGNSMLMKLLQFFTLKCMPNKNHWFPRLTNLTLTRTSLLWTFHKCKFSGRTVQMRSLVTELW